MYSIHYLIGLRYSYKTMLESEITIICSHYEMAVAKQLAFSLGKKIYPIFVFLMLFINYYVSKIMEQDYSESAKFYAD